MHRAACICALLALPLGATAALEPGDAEKIHELATELAATGQLNGGVLVAKGETVIYRGAFGWADRELGIPNTVDTRFFSASLGKMFTAILTMQLVDEGYISLDDPISNHLSWFDHPRAEEILVEHLLAHRSGLAEIFDERVNENPSESVPRELLATIAGLELDFAPGTAFSYSNTGYVLLAEIVKQHYRDDYDSILQARIFEPLGMSSTYWSRSIYGPGAPVYYLSDGTPQLPGDYLDFSGPGAEKTTLADLHKFMVAVLNEQLLSESSWERVLSPHSRPEEAMAGWGPHNAPYGYGFSLAELPHEGESVSLSYGHGGASAGASCNAVVFPSSGRIVITWNNQFIDPIMLPLHAGLASISAE
jgi:CubicO group peptidase (beta-lactamase class C family)